MTISIEKRFSHFFFIALFLMNFVGLMLLLPTLSFIMNATLSKMHFPLAFFLAGLINFFFFRRYFSTSKFYFIKSVALTSGLILLSISIATYFYDTSYDGQYYHQETLIQLKNGWNPFKQHLPGSMPVSIWLDHYPKGAEIPEAVIYTFFNKIESGKAVNLILLLSAFCLGMSVLSEIKKLSFIKVFLIASLLALNPVFTTQLFTYYVDIQLGLLLLCMLLLLCSLYFKYDKCKLIMLCVVIAITINIKFTSILYAGIIVSCALIMLLTARQVSTLRKVFSGSGIAVILGIVLIGYNPYIKNYMEHGNPFYPLAGEGKVDIMLRNSPQGFPDNNRFYNIALSVFSRTSAGLDLENETARLKPPFTFKVTELIEATSADPRLGGFGFLFSGIAVLSFFLLIIVLVKSTKKNRLLLSSLLSIVLLSGLSIEYGWWARYTPQFWFIPIIILIFSEMITNKSVSLLKNVVYGLLVANVTAISLFVLTMRFMNTEVIDHDLALIGAIKNNVRYVDFGDFRSGRIKFEEHGIDYVEHKITTGVIVDMKSIFTKVELKKQPPLVEASLGVRLYKFVYQIK